MSVLVLRRLFAILIAVVAMLGTESFAQAIRPCGTYSISVNVTDPTLLTLDVTLDLTDLTTLIPYQETYAGLGNGSVGPVTLQAPISRLDYVTVSFANGYTISFTPGTHYFCVGAGGTAGPCIQVTAAAVGSPCTFQITITELPAGSCPGC